MLALEPGSLSDEQGERLLHLKDLFEQTMPPNTSPVPTVPTEPTTSTSSAASTTSLPTKPKMKDQETQKDYVPALERVPPPPQVKV